MHVKFIVVDGVAVETGSFNFTKGAAVRNAENVVVLHDPDAAAAYGGNGSGYGRSRGGHDRLATD
jgi:phosphatidylserine/phosphatidylglycerophosphate/cardiolipin synthase-like enzyme